MSDSLRALFQPMLSGSWQPSLAELQAIWPGSFKVPMLESAAWETAGRTGALARVDPAVVSDLVRYYSLLGFYRDKLDRVADNLYVAVNLDPSHLRGLVLAFGILSNDISLQEKLILKVSNEVLERLSGEGEDGP